MDHIARFVVSVATAWALASAANAAALNDTGQVACFDVSTTSTGTVSGGTPAPEAAGFAGQDCSLGAAAADAVGAQVKIGGASVAGRDYSKIGNDGSVLPDTAVRGTGPTDWGCTRDNVTGLTWQLRGDLDKDYRYSWKSTPNVDNGGDTCGGALSPCDTDRLVAAANLAGLCGATGWTLPAPAQLESLLAYDDPGSSKNLIDRTWFPDQANDEVNPFVFWSSDAANADGTMAWAADFDFGWTTVASTGSAAYVRLVLPSSATSPTTRFTTSEPVSGEVVVEDAQTGLMWKQCPQGLSGSGCATGSLAAHDWSSALTAGGSEHFAGFTDWRLPNIIELASIRDYAPGSDVRLPAEFGASSAFDLYWSSTNTPRPTSLETALTYLYADSAAHSETFKNQTAAVRLVRAGGFLAAHAPGADTTPDAFSLPAKDASVSTLIESDAVSVSGLGAAAVASLAISGAADSVYRINDGSWTSGAGAVRNGDTVQVRHTSAASIGGTATTTLAIGDVNASFVSTVAEPLTIEFVGVPRTTFPPGYNFKSLIINSIDHQLLIHAPLSATASSLQLSVDQVYSGSVALDARAAQVSEPLLHAPGEFVASAAVIGARALVTGFHAGSVTLTYSVSYNGRVASVDRTIDFIGNQEPTAEYSTGSIRLPANAASGPYAVPDFVVSSSPGGESETSQTVTHQFSYSPNGGSIFNYPDVRELAVEGDTLLFQYNGCNEAPGDSRCGTFEFSIVPKDDAAEFSFCSPYNLGYSFPAGSCGTSSSHTVVVSVGDSIALGVAARRVEQSTTVRKAVAAAPKSGPPIQYRIEARNLGSLPVADARIHAEIPPQLGSASWTCNVPVGSCTPTSGVGVVDTRVDLGLDEAAEIIVAATLSPDADYVEFRAEGELPDGVQGAVVQPGGYLIDPVSSAFIFVGKFEGANAVSPTAP